jgi:hypothetical protein
MGLVPSEDGMSFLLWEIIHNTNNSRIEIRFKIYLI